MREPKTYPSIRQAFEDICYGLEFDAIVDSQVQVRIVNTHGHNLKIEVYDSLKGEWYVEAIVEPPPYP